MQQRTKKIVQRLAKKYNLSEREAEHAVKVYYEKIREVLGEGNYPEENTFKIDSLNSANIFNTINNISNSLTNFTSPYLHIPANFQKIKGNFDYSDIISTNFKNNILKFEQFKFYNIGGFKP